MNNQVLYYQASGLINPVKQGLSYAIGIAAALLLGSVYTLLTIFIPIVYANILIVVGFGISLGFVCQALVRFSHNRSKKSQLIHAVVIGVFANYFQWTTYILYVYNGSIPSISFYFTNLHWLVLPDFFSAVAEINREGLWSMFGITFNGFGLTLIWLFEFLIIMVGPILAITNAQTRPYSESFQQWYRQYTLREDFEGFVSPTQLKADMADDPVAAIGRLGKGAGWRHSKIHIFYLPHENKQYLTLEKVLVEGQGRGKKSSTVIIDNLQMSTVAADAILGQFEHERQA